MRPAPLTQFLSGQVQTASYTYDADGRRVKRTVTGQETRQVYGIDGELLAEYAAGASPDGPQTEYGYRAGELLVKASGQGASSNVALGKTATQSSNLATSTPASLAVDGNTNGDLWGGASSSATNPDYHAWWQVDLGDISSLQIIEVWSRTDCCPGHTANFYVLVSDQPFTSTDLDTARIQAGVSSYYTAGNGGYPTTINVNRTGRYVRVQRADTNHLIIGEVKVMGSPPPASNMALGKTATQSSNLATSTPASLAVDGNTNGDLWGGASSSATNPDYQAWWQVDLGVVKAIDTIKVWARTDCCSNHTANFYVLVSDAPFTSTDLTTTINQAGVSNYYTSGNGGRPTEVSVNRSGRYIRVQRADTNYLILAEVEVWGGGGAGGGGGSAPGVQWMVTDQLGTPRMVVDQTGSLAGVKRHDYLPFGEELTAGTGGRTTVQGYVGDSVRQKFAGTERDGETGLDFMQARYVSSTQGRFTSTDPIYFQKEMMTDPQRFNLYAYVRNNPLRYIDPLGMKLRVSVNGDPDETMSRVRRLAGGFADSLVFSPVKDKDGNIKYYDVSFNVTAKEISGNEGAQLVFDLVSSDKVFSAQTGGMVQGVYSNGKTFTRDVEKAGAGNLTRQRPGAIELPADPEVDSVIYISKNPVFTNNITDDVVQPISTFIHEASEAYLLTQGNSYQTSHGYYYSIPDKNGVFREYSQDPRNAISRERIINYQLGIVGGRAGYLRQEGLSDLNRIDRRQQ